MNGLAQSTAIHLPGHIAAYLRGLTAAYPEIVSIWLFGSRANGREKQDSDWDLLDFGNRSVLDALRQSRTFVHPEIDLFIVHDGNRFENPWPDNGEIKSGRLWSSLDPNGGPWVCGYNWHEVSARLATYFSTRNIDGSDGELQEDDGDSDGELQAHRVFPP